MPIIFIIFGILLLITIIIIIIRSRKKSGRLSEECSSNSDCPKTDVCIPNPEDGNKLQCFPADKKFCEIMPVSELTMCKLDDSTSCNMCLNNPQFSCVEVSNTKPYTWRKDNKVVKLPNSPPGFGWCLPNVVNRDITCNPYTSEYVLEQVGNNEYQWGCLCKYPNLFDHGGGDVFSDCTMVRACGEVDGFGNLYVPHPDSKKCKSNSDCENGDKCLPELSPSPCGVSSGGQKPTDGDCTTEDCYCHTTWSNEIMDQVNPLYGRCVCDSAQGLEYECIVTSDDSYQMNCVKGTCIGGSRQQDPEKCNQDQCKKDGTNCECCVCPTGMIRCPDDLPSDSIMVQYCLTNGPMCIPDPCATVPGGHWDKSKNSCVCPGGDGIGVYEDLNSSVGQICKNYCDPSPCGNRGTCTYDPTTQHATCTGCKCPWTNKGDANCTCSQTIMGTCTNTTPKMAYGEPCECDKQCCSGKCILIDGDGHCGHGKPPKPDNSPCKATHNQPVVCSDDFSCPYSTLCCPLPSGKFTCCPYANGTCCDDGEHCCPADYPLCDTSTQSCTTEDGKKSISWSQNKK